MSDRYAGRIIDVEARLKMPPPKEDLLCPTCRAATVAGWCTDCGIDWCDGRADELRAANEQA